MTRTVTVTEWACDHDHCKHTARVESVGSDPVPLPPGWRRKTDWGTLQYKDFCEAHA